MRYIMRLIGFPALPAQFTSVCDLAPFTKSFPIIRAAPQPAGTCGLPMNGELLLREENRLLFHTRRKD